MSHPATYVYWNQNPDRLNLLKEHGFISPADLSWTDRLLRFTRRVEVTCIQDANGHTWGVAYRRFRDQDVVVGTLDMLDADEPSQVLSYHRPASRLRPTRQGTAI